MTESLPVNKPETSDLKQCKFCAEEIRAAARICRFCNHDQEEELPAQRVQQDAVTETHTSNLEPRVSNAPEAERACAFCREGIKRDAIICAHCGKNLSPKSTTAAYLLFILFWWFGAHKFYLLQRGAGLFYLTCTLFSYFTLGLSLLPAAIYGLIDLFTMPGQVARFNQKLLGDSDKPINADEAPTATSVAIATDVVVILPLLLIGLLVILGLVAYEKFGHAPSVEQNSRAVQEAPSDATAPSEQQAKESDSQTEDNSSGLAVTEPGSLVSSESEEPVSQNHIKDLVSQMIMCYQSDSDFQRAYSKLSALPKPLPGDIKAAEEANPIGLKALRSKDYDAAVSAFRKAAEADPATARYLSNLGFAEMYTGDFDNAEKHTIQSLALAPDRRVAWSNLGQIKAKQDKQDEAIACFMIAYRLSNGESLVYLKSLDADDDPKIREVGRLALEKLGQTSTTGTTSNRP